MRGNTVKFLQLLHKRLATIVAMLAVIASISGSLPNSEAEDSPDVQGVEQESRLGYIIIPGSEPEVLYEIEEPAPEVEVQAETNDEEIPDDESIYDSDTEPELEEQYEEDPAETVEPTPEYTDEDLELLACVIYCEAGSDTISDETRRMVGEVVLNRVASEAYPNSILEVLTQKSQYGRFHWTGVVWPERAGRAVEAHAVERAYDCARLVFTEERLLPTDVIYQNSSPQGKETVVHVPGFYFCR